jgi:thioredoxin 1
MKILVFSTAIAIIVFILFGFKTIPEQIKTEEGIQFFTGTWQQALDKAKRENKLIFLDAYASWCGPCKMMKHKTFTDKAVGDFYNKNFINVAIDMGKGEGPALAEKYAVEAYPTLIFVKSDAKLIGKVMGFRKSTEFLEIGQEASKAK